MSSGSSPFAADVQGNQLYYVPSSTISSPSNPNVYTGEAPPTSTQPAHPRLGEHSHQVIYEQPVSATTGTSDLPTSNGSFAAFLPPIVSAIRARSLSPIIDALSGVIDNQNNRLSGFFSGRSSSGSRSRSRSRSRSPSSRSRRRSRSPEERRSSDTHQGCPLPQSGHNNCSRINLTDTDAGLQSSLLPNFSWDPDLQWALRSSADALPGEGVMDGPRTKNLSELAWLDEEKAVAEATRLSLGEKLMSEQELVALNADGWDLCWQNDQQAALIGNERREEIKALDTALRDSLRLAEEEKRVVEAVARSLKDTGRKGLDGEKSSLPAKTDVRELGNPGPPPRRAVEPIDQSPVEGRALRQSAGVSGAKNDEAISPRFARKQSKRATGGYPEQPRKEQTGHVNPQPALTHSRPTSSPKSTEAHAHRETYHSVAASSPIEERIESGVPHVTGTSAAPDRSIEDDDPEMRAAMAESLREYEETQARQDAVVQNGGWQGYQAWRKHMAKKRREKRKSRQSQGADRRKGRVSESPSVRSTTGSGSEASWLEGKPLATNGADETDDECIRINPNVDMVKLRQRSGRDRVMMSGALGLPNAEQT